MNMNLNVKKHEAKCDAENNPPTTIAKQVNVLVSIQFEDQYDGECFLLRLAVPLEELRAGKLESLRVGYATASDTRLWEPL